MHKVSRKVALALLKTAGAENDRQKWTRVYVENRISIAIANEMWREGQALARFIALRDAAKA